MHGALALAVATRAWATTAEAADPATAEAAAAVAAAVVPMATALACICAAVWFMVSGSLLFSRELCKTARWNTGEG